MLHLGENRARNTVNVLKKIKVDGQWKLCPAIVEPGGKLKDRVQINGRAEVHNEGVYYIEWRENGQRIRQSVPNRHYVLETARLKALELDARKAGIHAGGESAPPSSSTTAMIGGPIAALPSLEIKQISKAAGVILSGVESYLQGLINASVRSQLEALGIAPKEVATGSASLLGYASNRPRTDDAWQQPVTSGCVPARETGQTLISQAIDAYLKDVEPPQREQKTYDEYRSRRAGQHHPKTFLPTRAFLVTRPQGTC